MEVATSGVALRALRDEWMRDVSEKDREDFCRQLFIQNCHAAISMCKRCGLSERIHLRLELDAALAAHPPEGRETK